MNVAELIQALQEAPDLSASVTIAATVVGGAEIASVDMSGANSTTPPSDGPESSNETPDAGTVVLDD